MRICAKYKSVLNGIIERLVNPFKRDLAYFVLLWVIVAFPNCYSQLNNTLYVVYMAMMYYIIVYIVVMILNLNTYVAKVLKPVIFVVTLLWLLVNVYCYNVFNTLLSHDILSVIRETNVNEVKEFISIYISLWDVCVFLLVSVTSTCIFLIVRKNHERRTLIWLPMLFFLFISTAAVFHNIGMVKEEFFDRIRWQFNFDEVVDLRNHLTHPVLIETDSIHPDHIVIIIGESFSRNHSSLYGYDKLTNPLLERKMENGNLVVFNNITSPASNTTSAFKYILNTKLYDREDERKWYEHPNLVEVLNEAGYHTAWYSNQAEKGMFDNVPSSFSQICNEKHFLKSGKTAGGYDGELLNIIPPPTQTKSALFIHLMGQHEDFRHRYPDDFEHFTVADYYNCEKHQKSILASYDNATLYNDFVVDSLMSLYEGSNAIVIYFSDHALDLFDSEPDFWGHAKNTEKSQAYARDIPFMVYVSTRFKNNYSVEFSKIRGLADMPFSTDRLIYMVMGIAGYSINDCDAITQTHISLD